MFQLQVSWNVAKRMCIQEGLKAANINRNGENGITARLAEVNSQHKNNQLRRNALSGEMIENTDALYYEITIT